MTNKFNSKNIHFQRMLKVSNNMMCTKNKNECARRNYFLFFTNKNVHKNVKLNLSSDYSKIEFLKHLYFLFLFQEKDLIYIFYYTPKYFSVIYLNLSKRTLKDHFFRNIPKKWKRVSNLFLILRKTTFEKDIFLTIFMSTPIDRL